MYLVFLLFLFSEQVYSQETCGKQSIQKACDEMKAQSNVEFFSFDEGKVKNPYYRPVKSERKPEQNFEALQNSSIEFQASVLAALKGNKKRKLSDKFIMAFLNSGIPSYIGNPQTLSLGFGAFGNTGMNSFALPLPPDDEKAPLRPVNLNELDGLLFQWFDAKTIAKISETAKKNGDQTDSANLRAVKNRPTVYSSPRDANPVAKNKARIERIFKEVKRILIQDVTKGVARVALTPEQASLVDRIQTIKLIHGDANDVAESSSCSKNYLNAFYQPDEHSISICPSYYEQPNFSLYRMIAHEIGHSFDPCKSSYSLVKASVSYPDEPQSRATSYLLAQGPFSEKSTVSGPISEDKHPYASVVSCLADKANFRKITADDILLSAKTRARFEQNQNATSDKVRIERQASLIAEASGERQCYETLTHASELNEAMADVYGSMAVNEYSKTVRPKNAIEALSFYNGQYEIICLGLKHPIDKLSIKEARALALEKHPDQINRIERITLNIPAVSSAMKCKPNPQFQCFDYKRNTGGSGSWLDKLIGGTR